MIFFCCGMSASCSPWASHSPCSACKVQVLPEFQNGTAALALSQSRSNLCTVFLPMPVMEGDFRVSAQHLLSLSFQGKFMHLFTDLPSSPCNRAPPGASAHTEQAGSEFTFFRETAFGLVSHMDLENKEDVRIIFKAGNMTLLMAATVPFLLANYWWEELVKLAVCDCKIKI